MFKTVARAARVGRNPQSGKPLEIPPATIVKFRAGKRLKDAVQFSGKFDASTKPRK